MGSQTMIGAAMIAASSIGTAASDDEDKWQRLLDTINSPQGESWLSVHPSGNLALYDQHDDGFGHHRIYFTQYEDGAWQAPVLAPFAVDVDERGARFSPDGNMVVFSSKRSEGGAATDDWNIWKVTLSAQGWSNAEMLPEPVNSSAPDIHPAMDGEGSIYFSSRRPGGKGASDMYLARIGQDGWQVKPVNAFNTERSEPDTFLWSSGNRMIFARTDGAGGFGGDDLYFTQKVDGVWQAEVNLGKAVNTKEYEYGASLSPDGKFLFYSTFAAGHADIRMVPLKDVVPE